MTTNTHTTESQPDNDRFLKISEMSDAQLKDAIQDSKRIEGIEAMLERAAQAYKANQTK